MKNKITLFSALFITLAMTGCTTAPKQSTHQGESTAHSGKRQAGLNGQVDSNEILEQLRVENERLSRENAQLSKSSQSGPLSADDALLPPNAKPGECYARVLIPSKYSVKTERVIKKPASYRVQVMPPKYAWAEEKVLVKEAGEKLKVIPATYRWQNETIVVKEASEKMIAVPARYKTVSEKVLVRPAYSTWKKGKGPIQKVDNATGEIMCLVEVPAEYKTVVREELVEQATTKKIQIPAEYKIVKKRVLVAPEKVVKQSFPSEYRTIKVKKVIQPATETRIEIPAEFTTVKKRTKLSDSVLEWRPILCETNTNPGLVSRLQQALINEGFDPGDVDGEIGSRTTSALAAYQKKEGLASGQITMETLKSLGLSY